MHEQGETNRFKRAISRLQTPDSISSAPALIESISESLASWEQPLFLMRQRLRRGSSLTHSNADRGSATEAATVVA